MTNSELRDKFWDLWHEAEKLKSEIEEQSYLWWKADGIVVDCIAAINKLDEAEQ